MDTAVKGLRQKDLRNSTPELYRPQGTPLPATLKGRTLDTLSIGDSVAIERTLRPIDLEVFAVASGDVNPQHLDPVFAADTYFEGVIAHGMWGGALISAVLGTHLPGPGTIYLGQTLRFKAPVRLGDTLTVRLTVSAIDTAKRRVTLACQCTNQHGQTVIEGEATVMPPQHASSIAAAALPPITVG